MLEINKYIMNLDPTLLDLLLGLLSHLSKRLTIAFASGPITKVPITALSDKRIPSTSFQNSDQSHINIV